MTRHHVHLIAPDPTRPALLGIAAALREAGHHVTLSAGPPPREADLVLHADAPRGTGLSLEAAESRHLADVLAHTGGNRRQAALLLGIARSTLLAKIRKYGL